MSADPPVVSIEDISKVFGKGGVAALEGIGLDVERGEFVSLIGPSGCGKTTLMRVVADLAQPTAGTLLVNGGTAEQARLDRSVEVASAVGPALHLHRPEDRCNGERGGGDHR